MKKLLFILIVPLVIVGCKTSKKSSQGKESDASGVLIEPDQVRPSVDTRFEQKFFEAQLYKSKGEIQKAYEAFSECLQVQPNEPSVNYEMARIERSVLLNASSAAQKIEKSVKANPKNPWYHRLQGEIYMDQGKYELAAKSFDATFNLNPDDQAALYDKATALLTAGKINEAIAAYDQLEKIVGPFEELSFQKHELYMEQGNLEKAARELEKLAEAFPSEARYWGLVAQFYYQNNQKEKAKLALDKMVLADPDNGQVHYQLSEYYAATGDEVKSYDELKKAFQTTDLSIDQKVMVLMKYYDLTMFNPNFLGQAFELLDLTVKLHPKEAKAYSILGDFLFRERKEQQALDAFKSAAELDASKSQIWEQIISLELALSKHDLLIKDGEKAIELFPNMPAFYLYTGYGYERKGQTQNAIDRWSMGKELVIDNPRLLAQFYSSLGSAYNKQKNFAKSDESFDKSLSLFPEDAFTLNNYAYYLSLRKIKLEKAAQMSKKSIDLEPENPSFHDTYAWILFHQGNYQEALTWIEKAVSASAKPSGEVLEHYGDILFRLGRTNDALEAWKEALKAGGGSEQLSSKINKQSID